VQTVELRQVDLRYERLRLQEQQRERSLLCSIQEKGVLEPLQGVFLNSYFILLDGFKRYRVAKRLGIQSIPCLSLAEDEASAMIQLIRIANSKSLHILEQSRIVDELHKVHGLSVVEIARRLERSAGWVSMRIGVLKDIPASIEQELFNGKFPAYSYLYTLRQFIRMKQAQKPEVEQFVKAVSGKQLSVRNIDLLARGFFQGNAELRAQILNGKLEWSLNQLKALGKATGVDENKAHLNESEIKLIRDLSILQKYLCRLGRALIDPRITSAVFAEGNLLAGGALSQMEKLQPGLRRFYDQSR
jgi:hypothetical protein